jgi:small subunit ribosomal protein S4
MARYTGPRVRVARRIGFNVFENRKGDKALQDRPYPPGENGRKRTRETDYGTQLKEKQKVRYMYGVLEKQFRNYYKEASRMQGITGENLLYLLESRLDNLIYRAGFASTRPQARQLVSHRHFKVNGNFVDVPSYHVQPGDEITIKDSSKGLIIIQHTIDTGQDRVIPSWINVDNKNKSVKVVASPSRSDASSQIEEQLIVELYSK